MQQQHLGTHPPGPTTGRVPGLVVARDTGRRGPSGWSANTDRLVHLAGPR